jgi:NADH:ubiquinone oxidoreductase subunit E
LTEEGATSNDLSGDASDVGAARDILEKHGLLADRPRVGLHMERARELLIPVLQDIQATYGYLPQKILRWIEEETGIPSSRMYGIITFYSQFYLKPTGKHTVKCCQGTACHVKGGKAVAEAIEEHLGVGDGGTTGDMLFTYETVQCLGTCFLAPVVMVGDDYHSGMTRGSVKKTLSGYS